MAVRIETQTISKDIAVIEIPKSDKSKLLSILIIAALSILTGFIFMILGSIVIARWVQDITQVSREGATYVTLTLVTLFGSLGVGIYLLLKIAKHFDRKTDAFLKSYGWDGEMSYRIDYVD